MAALAAQIIFGFSFMSTKISLDYASPMTVIADRYLVAFFAMTIVMIITGTKIKLKKGFFKLILMSAFQPLLYFIFETYGIKLTTSAFSSVMISLIPVVSMVSGIFVLGEIPALKQYIFAAVSVAGVVIMALEGKSDGTVTAWGIVFLCGAVISSVAYNIASRKISSEFTVFERTYAMTVIGMVSFVLIALAENIKNPVAIVSSFTNIDYTGAIAYLGIVSSVIAFLLLNYANTYLPVAKTTMFSNVTMVVSVSAGIIILKEPFSIEILISALMIIAGVIGSQLSGIKAETKP